MSYASFTLPTSVSKWMGSRHDHKPTTSATNQGPTGNHIDYSSRSSSSPTIIGHGSNNTGLDHFSDRLKVFIGTWNMYGRLLPIDLSTFLTEHDNHKTSSPSSLWLDGSATHPYHLLVIGTQECERDISESLFYPSKEVWEKRLSDYLGPQYKSVKTETLAALHVAVFVWAPVAALVRDVQSESIKTGWANMIGNKGAVAISVLFGTRLLLFINCHLTAHQTKNNERNANIQRILYDLKMPSFVNISPNKKKTYKSVVDQFDHVFLFGDTNYRINAERAFVLEALRQGNYNALLEYDQLSIERRTEKSPLNHFQEHPIQFPPTYKLDTMIYQYESESDSNNDLSSSATLNLSTTNNSSSNLHSRLTPKQSLKSTTIETATNIKRKISRKLTSLNNNCSNSNNEKDQKDELSSPTSQIIISPTKLKSSISFSSSRSSSSSSPSSSTSTITNSCILRSSSTSSSLPVAQPPAKTTVKPNLVDSQITITAQVVLNYDSSEKQRVPSWTDRILWCDRSSIHHLAPPPTLQLKTSNKLLKKKYKNKTLLRSNKKRPNLLFPFRTKRHFIRDTVCYSYDAVLHQNLIGVSDHMPVIGVFGIWYDEWHLLDQPFIAHDDNKKQKWWMKWKMWLPLLSNRKVKTKQGEEK